MDYSWSDETPSGPRFVLRVRHTYTVHDAREAMQMPWATIAGLSQAIPPAYSHYIGCAALKLLGLEANDSPLGYDPRAGVGSRN